MNRLIFSTFLENTRLIFIKSILICNNDIITHLSPMLPPPFTSIDGIDVPNITNIKKYYPLWTIGGGEAINLNSFNHTLTKDLDAKIIVTGDISIPIEIKELFVEAANSDIFNTFRKKIWNQLFLFNDGNINYNDICNIDIWNKTLREVQSEDFIKNLSQEDEYFKAFLDKRGIELISDIRDRLHRRFTDIHSEYNKVLNLFSTSRRYIIKSILQTYTHPNKQVSLFYPNSKNKMAQDSLHDFLKSITSFEDLANFAGQQNIITENIGHGVTETYIPIKINVPFFIIGGLHSSKSFPYSIYNFETKKNIDELSLNDPEGNQRIRNLILQLNSWSNLNPENRETIIDLYITLTSDFNINTYLHSLIGIVIKIYKDERAEGQAINWKMKFVYEGLLDLFIDYSGRYAEEGKLTYEGKNLDGSIPCIVESVPFCFNQQTGEMRNGFLKIPTMNWLIRDQTRMLYHAIRGIDTVHKEWTDTTFGFKASTIDPYKYITKIKGLLDAYMNVIEQIENNLKNPSNPANNIIQLIRTKFHPKCNDITGCGPDSFISELIFMNNQPYVNKLLLTCEKAREIISYGGKRKKIINHKKTHKKYTKTQNKKQ